MDVRRIDQRTSARSVMTVQDYHGNIAILPVTQ
jgi:hypothetical protein